MLKVKDIDLDALFGGKFTSSATAAWEGTRMLGNLALFHSCHGKDSMEKFYNLYFWSRQLIDLLCQAQTEALNELRTNDDYSDEFQLAEGETEKLSSEHIWNGVRFKVHLKRVGNEMKDKPSVVVEQIMFGGLDY